MADFVLNVDVRENTGTGNARAVRREGGVPGILYGGGKDPVSISLRQNQVLKALNSGNLIGNMVKISHDGKEQFAMTQDVQFHPVKDMPLHLDFYRVTEDSIITVEVSINLVGEDDSPGLKAGGTLNVVRYTIEVNCPAGSIPDALDVDVSALEIGDAVHISDINMPKGVESAITDRDPTVLTVVASRSAADEEEDEGEVVEAGDVPTAGDDEATEEGDE